MRKQIQVLATALVVLLFSGCSRMSPELEEASRSFIKRQDPQYVVRSITAVKSDSGRKAAEVEFDAPNNLKNRGRASLLFDRQADGSWQCVRSEISMWTK